MMREKGVWIRMAPSWSPHILKERIVEHLHTPHTVSQKPRSSKTVVQKRTCMTVGRLLGSRERQRAMNSFDSADTFGSVGNCRDALRIVCCERILHTATTFCQHLSRTFCCKKHLAQKSGGSRLGVGRTSLGFGPRRRVSCRRASGKRSRLCTPRILVSLKILVRQRSFSSG